MLLRRVLRRRLARVAIETEVLRSVLRRGNVIEGAQKAETRPFAEYNPLRVHPTKIKKHSPFRARLYNFGARQIKERRRGRAEKRLSKKVFLESPFLLCSLKVFRTFQMF